MGKRLLIETSILVQSKMKSIYQVNTRLLDVHKSYTVEVQIHKHITL